MNLKASAECEKSIKLKPISEKNTTSYCTQNDFSLSLYSKDSRVSLEENNEVAWLFQLLPSVNMEISGTSFTYRISWIVDNRALVTRWVWDLVLLKIRTDIRMHHIRYLTWDFCKQTVEMQIIFVSSFHFAYIPEALKVQSACYWTDLDFSGLLKLVKYFYKVTYCKYTCKLTYCCE